MPCYSEYPPYLWYGLLRIKLSTRCCWKEQWRSKCKPVIFLVSAKSLMVCHLKEYTDCCYGKLTSVRDCKTDELFLDYRNYTGPGITLSSNMRHICCFVFFIMEYFLPLTTCPQFCFLLLCVLNLGKKRVRKRKVRILFLFLIISRRNKFSQ